MTPSSFEGWLIVAAHRVNLHHVKLQIRRHQKLGD